MRDKLDRLEELERTLFERRAETEILEPELERARAAAEKAAQKLAAAQRRPAGFVHGLLTRPLTPTSLIVGLVLGMFGFIGVVTWLEQPAPSPPMRGWASLTRSPVEREVGATCELSVSRVDADTCHVEASCPSRALAEEIPCSEFEHGVVMLVAPDGLLHLAVHQLRAEAP